MTKQDIESVKIPISMVCVGTSIPTEQVHPKGLLALCGDPIDAE